MFKVRFVAAKVRGEMKFTILCGTTEYILNTLKPEGFLKRGIWMLKFLDSFFLISYTWSIPIS